ncbi:MAG: serine hydrolase domain-containing protein [Candidatus Thorarchaeota archaeon]
MRFEVEIKHFEEKILELKKRFFIPGISVAISLENGIIFAKGFGYADIGNKIEATPTTPYRIASLTKPIASTIILQLVEKGILELDKSIAEYIPGYLEICEKNRKLLEERNLVHLIKNYHFKNQNITIRHHLQQTIVREPGEEYEYNGLLFGFLGIAVDFQIAEKFLGLVRKNIIDTLDMVDSLPCQEDVSKPEVLKRLAKPYRINKEFNYELSEYPQKNGSAAAGIVSTVIDYMKFDKAINTNTLIQEKTKEMAFTNPKTKTGKELPYGLGWFIQEVKEHKVVWHYGLWDNSFSSLYLKIPSMKLSLVMFANSDGLSKLFNLHEGNILTSPFAKSFLDIFL